MFGICEAKSGTDTCELLQTRTNGHQRIWQNAEKNSDSRRRKSPSKGGKKTGELRERMKELQETCTRGFLNKFEMEGLLTQKGLWNLAKENILKERGQLPNEEGDAVREF